MPVDHHDNESPNTAPYLSWRRILFRSRSPHCLLFRSGGSDNRLLLVLAAVVAWLAKEKWHAVVVCGTRSLLAKVQ